MAGRNCGRFYKNSHFTTSFYAAYGIYFPLNTTLFAGLRNIVATGYPSNSYRSGLIVGPLPTVKLELSTASSLNLSFIPKKNAIIFANLGYKF